LRLRLFLPARFKHPAEWRFAAQAGREMNMGVHFSRRMVLGGALSAPLIPGSGFAQTRYPDRPIRMIVGFAPGGGTDLTARAMAPRLAQALGQPVVVENRPGAGGNIATEVVVRAAADGYTVLMGTIAALAVNPSLYTTLTFNPLTDLAAVGLAVTTHDVLVVHPSLGIDSVPALIEMARRNSGGMTFGTSGVGTAGHLSGELFNLLTEAKLIHVPYRGGGPLINDLLSGQIKLSFASIATTAQYVDLGRLKGLATTGAQRSDRLPDLPTVAEAGVPGYESNNWYGMVVPRAVPPTIVSALNAALNDTLADPEVAATLQRQGLAPAPGTPGFFAEYIRTETEKWGRVMRAAGATAN
jgi:tripartite-type tricarboxylate transporter receptor subunit TctC